MRNTRTPTKCLWFHRRVLRMWAKKFCPHERSPHPLLSLNVIVDHLSLWNMGEPRSRILSTADYYPSISWTWHSMELHTPKGSSFWRFMGSGSEKCEKTLTQNDRQQCLDIWGVNNSFLSDRGSAKFAPNQCNVRWSQWNWTTYTSTPFNWTQTRCVTFFFIGPNPWRGQLQSLKTMVSHSEHFVAFLEQMDQRIRNHITGKKQMETRNKQFESGRLSFHHRWQFSTSTMANWSRSLRLQWTR